MTTGVPDRLERLFRAARLHPPDEQAAFLAAACPDDDALRAEVESLLALDAEADDDGFLDRAATGLIGEATAAPEETPDPLIGESVGPYRVLRSLGVGGMGAVYLAVREVPFVRYVALKVVRGLASPEALDRFEQERQILASLDHPGIARLIDGGLTDPVPGGPNGLPYFALDYVEGRALTDYADEHRLGLDDRIALFRQVCEAVRYAHQNLVLHRDLKPSNILVTTAGTGGEPQVRLLDFGIAKLLNPALGAAAGPVTQTALRPLTPAYASPEQVRGEPLTTASDVYGLGVILYELLVGRRPYEIERGAPEEVAQTLLATEPERPSAVAGRLTDGDESASAAHRRDTTPAQLAAALRGDLDAVVLKALRKEPERRYASAEALGQDLERFEEGLPVRARRGTRLYRLGKTVRRHRAEATAAALVVAALVVGLGAAVWQARVAGAERDRTALALRQSEAVEAFLVSLFEAADPADVPGDTLTAVELLDRGVRRAEALSDEPAVQARLLGTMAAAYRAQGRPDAAAPLHERALDGLRSALGPEHEAVADALVEKAETDLLLGAYPAADRATRTALAIQRQALGPDHAATGETHALLSRISVYLGDIDGAVAEARRALAVREAALGDGHPTVGQSWSLLGRTLRRRGDTAEAEAAFEQAATVAEARYGPDHPDLADALLQSAYTLANGGQAGRAETLARRALAIRRRALGPDHPLSSEAIGDIAEILSKQGRHEEALTLNVERTVALERVFGPDHPQVLSARGDHARSQEAVGRVDEAEAWFRVAVTEAQRVHGAGHPVVAGALAGLGAFLLRQGRPAEAERPLRQGLAIAEAAHGADSPDAARIQTALAEALAAQGRYADAEPVLRQALATYERRDIRPSHGIVQETLQQAADLYEAWGRPEEAARYRHRLGATGD